MGKTQPKWSARSQRSIMRQNEIQQQLAQCEGHIRYIKRGIADLEAQKAGQLRHAMISEGGGRVGPTEIGRTVNELKNRKFSLEAFQEHKKDLESKIAKLNQSDPAADEARAAQQDRLAELAGERLEKDRFIQAVITDLRQQLRERARLSATMVEVASSIDIDFDPDAERFDQLLDSLQADVLAESEAWAAWFLGEDGAAKPYIVTDSLLIGPEALAHNGVYRFGETIMLADADAAELLRTDRPAGMPSNPWRCQPPSITTIEAHQEAIARAKEEGLSVEQFYAVEEIARDRAAEKAFRVDSKLSVGPRPSRRFRTLRTTEHTHVRVRAKTPITAGREYAPGEVLEVSAESARALIQSGAAEMVSGA